jgi:mannose-1-phosphate guanylyltransferase/mannose-6-phosphate isomerase
MQFLKQCQPLIYGEILRLTPENLSELYNQLPSLSMDYGLAEPLTQASAKVAVVPINMSWSDLGSWDSIYKRHVKDSHNNSIHGDVVCLDTQNSLIWTETGLIAALGLDNIAVIQTTDATLICDRSRVEDVKELVAEVKVSQPALTEIHQTVFRPWGTYTVLQEGRNFKTKRISVNPGEKLSLQMHNHRSEHWVVVSGVATITINDVESTLQENESTYIQRMQKHRLENRSEKLLEIIEVQCGNYLGEDDIVRFEDQYGRIAK